MIRSLPLLLLAASACGAGGDPARAVQTFSERCLGCHRPDGAWPPLHDPAALPAFAPLAAEAVETGAMPPWAPSTDGPPLRDDLSLGAEEREQLVRWLQDGAPRPDGEPLIVPPRRMLDADLLLPLPEHEVRGDQTRCFLVDLPDRSLTGFDVVANAQVHHVLLGVHDPAERGRFEAMDQADPLPGWDCPNAFMPSADPAPLRVPVRWFPNPHPAETLPGTGIPMGGIGVLQVHGLGSGLARGELQLRTESGVLPEADLVLGGADIDLPPAEHEVEVQYKAYVRSLLRDALPAEGAVWVTAARGHGHTQLERLRLELDGRTLIDLTAWDPRIQPRYRLQRPIRADLDAVLSLTCTYTNTPEAREEARIYGDEGEMCGGWVYVTAEEPF